MSTVFDQNTNTENNSNPNPPSSPDDLLKMIVNEKGEPKYKSVEDALKALSHAQTHIATLETEASTRSSEINELRTKAAQAEALEQVIERLQQNNPSPPVKTPPAGMSEAQTVEALEQIVAKRETARQMQANLDLVQSTLISKFGDENATRAAVAAKAAELGISTQDLAALSSKSPKAALAYFGLVDSKGTNQPVTPSSSSNMKTPADPPLERPKKSVLTGATSKEQKDFMLKVKEQVYKQHGVEV